MSNYRNTTLITPPKEEEEIYPYRRAWRSIAIESIILLIVVAGSYLAFGLLGISLPDNIRLGAIVGIALLPTLLWIIFSRLPERFVQASRPRLATVFVMSALVANAIGQPLLEDLIQPNQWLSLQPTVTRIIGYTATVGILQETLKYLVLRYAVWPRQYRNRGDAVAYGAASALGYALVLNLAFIAQNPLATVDVVALRVLVNITLQMVGSLIVAYGLAQTLFDDAIALLLPSTLVLAALFNGLLIPLRAGFANAPLGLTVSASRDWLGLAVTGVFYIGPMLALLFLFNVAEVRERDKLSGQDV